MENILIFLYAVIIIGSINLLWCLYKIFSEKAKKSEPKQLTKQQTEQLQKANAITGQLIALSGIIGVVIGTILEAFLSHSVNIPFDIIFCITDRESLKKQSVWEKGKIAWGWCLLSPVYLYKRTKLLKESLLKFWLLVIQIGLLVSFVINATLSLYTANVKQCIDRLAQDGVNVYVAKEVCECSMEYNEKFCLKRYEIIE